MEKVIRYKAYDGFLFETPEEALAHEKRLSYWETPNNCDKSKLLLENEQFSRSE